MFSRVFGPGGGIDRSKYKPIIFKDGKRVDFSVGNEEWLDDDLIQEEMSYMMKMAEGLATGTMSADSDYMELKAKIIKDLIKDRTRSFKKKLSKGVNHKIRIYDDAAKINDDVVKSYQEYVAQVTKDSTVSVYFDESTGDYKIENTGPVLVHNASNAFKKGSHYHTINLKTLGEEISKRKEAVVKKKTVQEIKDEEILKEVNEKLQKQNPHSYDAKLTKKVVEARGKKTKKKVAKKKTKKSDRK